MGPAKAVCGLLAFCSLYFIARLRSNPRWLGYGRGFGRRSRAAIGLTVQRSRWPSLLLPARFAIAIGFLVAIAFALQGEHRLIPGRCRRGQSTWRMDRPPRCGRGHSAAGRRFVASTAWPLEYASAATLHAGALQIPRLLLARIHAVGLGLRAFRQKARDHIENVMQKCAAAKNVGDIAQAAGIALRGQSRAVDMTSDGWRAPA